MHRERTPDVSDLHHIRPCDLGRPSNRSTVHFPLKRQLVDEPPSSELFAVATVLAAPHQVGGIADNDVSRRGRKALCTPVGRFLGLFGFEEVRCSGRRACGGAYMRNQRK